jgi:hypothetical protein
VAHFRVPGEWDVYIYIFCDSVKNAQFQYSQLHYT